MNEDIELLENNLNINCPILLKSMRPGLENLYMDSLLTDTILCYDNIKQLYKRKNGYSDELLPSFTKYCFHPSGNFLPLERAVKLYIEYEKQGIWDYNLFPFMTNNYGDYLLMDIEKKSPTYGMIYISSASLLISPPQTIYDDFTSFVKSLTHCHASGAYIYRKRTNELEVNCETERKFSEYFNPKSSFWKADD